MTDAIVVNEGPEGEPVVVLVARFSLGAGRDSPDFGASGLHDSESCRRMAISRDIADRLVTEAGWRVAEFEAAMLEGHDVDDEVAPVAWGRCRDYREDGDGGGVGVGTIASGI